MEILFVDSSVDIIQLQHAKISFGTKLFFNSSSAVSTPLKHIEYHSYSNIKYEKNDDHVVPNK